MTRRCEEDIKEKFVELAVKLYFQGLTAKQAIEIAKSVHLEKR